MKNTTIKTTLNIIMTILGVGATCAAAAGSSIPSRPRRSAPARWHSILYRRRNGAHGIEAIMAAAQHKHGA